MKYKTPSYKLLKNCDCKLQGNGLYPIYDHDDEEKLVETWVEMRMAGYLYWCIHYKNQHVLFDPYEQPERA